MVQTEHIDPTALALFAVAIVSVPLALSNLWPEGPATNYGLYFPFLGFVILVCALMAYLMNNPFGFVVLAIAGGGVYLAGTGIDSWTFIAFAIMFAICLVWSVMMKTPKLLSAVLLTTALVFLFFGLMDAQLLGPSDGLRIATGVIAVFNFIESCWLATALATEGKMLPII